MTKKTIRQTAGLILVAFILVITAKPLRAQHDHMGGEATPLTQPGNDIFGTIQEVIQQLKDDPETNWSDVNLEALRQHLLDMKAFTEEVEVLSRNPAWPAP